MGDNTWIAVVGVAPSGLSTTGEAAMILLGDNLDGHAAGWSALGGTLILAIGMWITRFLDSRERQRKLECESQERKAQIEAASQLALRNADIAAKTAVLTAKVDVQSQTINDLKQYNVQQDDKLCTLEKEHEECRDNTEVMSKKLDECEEKHKIADQERAKAKSDMATLKMTVAHVAEQTGIKLG